MILSSSIVHRGNEVDEMKIVAYKERMSMDSITCEEGILRKEWRIVPIQDHADRLEELLGPRSAWSKPYATVVLEMRYVRRGAEEPWQFFQTANTEEHALEYVEGDATPVDDRLVDLQKRRIEYDEKMRRESEEEKMREREYQETRRVALASEAAFVRLLNSKWRDVALRWNDFVKKHKGSIDMESCDDKFMALYAAVVSSETVPSKRKSIREFLEYAERDMS